jgi:hypothetical protein
LKEGVSASEGDYLPESVCRRLPSFGRLLSFGRLQSTVRKKSQAISP